MNQLRWKYWQTVLPHLCQLRVHHTVHVRTDCSRDCSSSEGEVQDRIGEIADAAGGREAGVARAAHAEGCAAAHYLVVRAEIAA